MEWSSGSKRKDPAVKVVIIGTQFVETNPLSFKSVVQSYTGKDSCVSWVEETSYKKAAPKRKRTTQQSSPASAATCSSGPAPAPNLSTCRSSFKDWERWMLELPTPEEMRWMWTDHYNS